MLKHYLSNNPLGFILLGAWVKGVTRSLDSTSTGAGGGFVS